jgi:DNA-binding NtrC family response regulator
LCDHFAAKYARANGLPRRPLSEPALARLHQQPWKGNVRELENCVHRAVLMASGDQIGPEAILLQGSGASRPRAAATAGGGALVGRTVADVERALILDTLQHTLGNRTHAATHSRHLDPHAAQQAAPVRRRGSGGAAAGRGWCRSRHEPRLRQRPAQRWHRI